MLKVYKQTLITYKQMSIVEKSVIQILFFLSIAHISIIALCFNFGFLKQLFLCIISILVWSLGIFYIMTIHWYKIKEKRFSLQTLPKQLFLVASICAAFVISAYVSTYTNILFSARVCFFWSVFISLSLVSGICWIYTAYDNNPSFVSTSLTAIQKNGVFWIVLIISFVIRIGMLDTLQRWDAGEYYYSLGNACANFDFYWDNFFHNFRLCNHTTLGFSFIMSIGEFLNPRGGIGVLCVNLLLTMYALYKLYHLLSKVLQGHSKLTAALVTLVCSVTPFFLGSFGYLTPDYIMAVCFILAICAEYDKEYLSEFFWMIIAINTKEPAIFTVFGYFLFKVISMLTDKKNLEKPIYSIIKNKSLWVGLCSGILYLIILKLQGGFLWKGLTNTKPIQFSNTETNSFGINFPYIVFRLKQHFILNFAWIFTVLLAITIVTICFRLFRKQGINKLASDTRYFLISLSGALLFALVANCVFVTAGAYRYTTVYFTLYGVFVLAFFWEYIGSSLNHFITPICYSAIAIIMFVEAFIHIDFISAKFFETRSTGSWYTVMTNATHDTYGNDVCNNYQYTWLDTAFDNMLKQINYDGSQDILIMGGQEQGSQLGGNGSYYRVCWDKLRKKRVMYDDTMLMKDKNLTLLNFIIEKNFSLHLEAGTLRENAVVFFIPYYQVDESACLEFLSAFYQIGEAQVAQGFGGNIRYYTLSLIQ